MFMYNDVVYKVTFKETRKVSMYTKTKYECRLKPFDSTFFWSKPNKGFLFLLNVWNIHFSSSSLYLPLCLIHYFHLNSTFFPFFYCIFILSFFFFKFLKTSIFLMYSKYKRIFIMPLHSKALLSTRRQFYFIIALTLVGVFLFTLFASSEGPMFIINPLRLPSTLIHTLETPQTPQHILYKMKIHFLKKISNRISNIIVNYSLITFRHKMLGDPQTFMKSLWPFDPRYSPASS